MSAANTNRFPFNDPLRILRRGVSSARPVTGYRRYPWIGYPARSRILLGDKVTDGSELYGSLSLLLHDDGPGGDAIPVRDISDT